MSIQDIKQSNTTTTDYGTFSVVLRHINDTDSDVRVLERFDNCTLDPASPDFVARKIGDTFEKWDETTRTLNSYGEYENKSKYVRVEMDTSVEEGATDPTLLPFGYFGPPKFRDAADIGFLDTLSASATDNRFVVLGSGFPGFDAGTDGKLMSSSFGSAASASFVFPSDLLRNSGSDGAISDQTKAYYGIQTTRTSTSTKADLSIGDMHSILYGGLGQTTNVPVDVTAASYNVSTTGS